ncbi:endonuclease domain-containing protein [Streptomyces sp. NY05-11A]|uniref:endonuclease domain-containing protein n=1 Tax=Streptomyces soliscabiei TaxID=588897 RepID=UPI0029B12F4E|nr:endonuclease domain-containing protein [Streptomyces sp. NY05-11A]MDX2683681.1 endonuclease domain-containing protein [Streptomyces sp. NY05-11A]
MTRLITASIDRYGFIVVWRDMTKLSRCNRACLDAGEAECSCSCKGANHGLGNRASWFQPVGDALVAELGEITRAAVIYGAKTSDTDPSVYDGQLDCVKYSPDAGKRKNWPRASQFICSACVTSRASVWDHCHTHGYVRAPLCNRCNTRSWRGWKPQYGRTSANHNVDDTYYQRCPGYQEGENWPCSP